MKAIRIFYGALSTLHLWLIFSGYPEQVALLLFTACVWAGVEWAAKDLGEPLV